MSPFNETHSFMIFQKPFYTWQDSHNSMLLKMTLDEQDDKDYHLMNEFIMTVFVEQPGSTNYNMLPNHFKI